MSFFDPLKPDRPEFDDIEQDTSKIIVFDPQPVGMEDFIFPPAPPYGLKGGTKVTKLPAGNLVEDILLDSERRSDERKANWWRRLWSR